MAAAAALPKRHFTPKAPSPRGPPDGVCTPRRHGGAGPPHTPEPTASRRTALGRGGRTARAGPSTRASAQTACAAPTPAVSPGKRQRQRRTDKRTSLHDAQGFGGQISAAGAHRRAARHSTPTCRGRRRRRQPCPPPPPWYRPRRRRAPDGAQDADATNVMPERGNEHLPSGSKSLSRLPGRPGALRTEIAHAALGKSPFAAWARSAVDRQRAAERPDKGVAEQGELVAHGARPPNYGSAASRHVADATCRVHFAGMARVWLHGSAARAVAAALGASSSPKARSRAPGAWDALLDKGALKRDTLGR